MYRCHLPLIMRIIDPQYINRAPMQLHCQMQDKNENNTKEDRQGRGLDKGAQHSKGPRLKPQMKEDSVTNLSDTSKTNNRYELSLCNCSDWTQWLIVFTSRRKNLCSGIALWIVLQVPDCSYKFTGTIDFVFSLNNSSWLCWWVVSEVPHSSLFQTKKPQKHFTY